MSSVYIVELEQSRYFVYLHPDSDSDSGYSNQNILSEIEIMFEFAQKYRPIRIINKYIKTSPFQLDNTVKLLMAEHGMNMVRGGTYVSETLSPQQIEHIQQEIYTASNPQISANQAQGYRFLLQKYMNRNWTHEDACFELVEINNEYDSYIEIKTIYNKIPEFDRDVIQTQFAELREYCFVQNFPDSQDITSNDDYCDYWSKCKKQKIPELYYSILKTAKTIFETYSQFYSIDQTEDVYLKYPFFLLDAFFIHRLPGTKDKLHEIYVFCDNMLYMFEKLQNFKMKLLGELLSQRIPNIEWTVPRIQYFLLSVSNRNSR